MTAEPKGFPDLGGDGPVLVGTLICASRDMLLPQAARAWDRRAGPGTSAWCPGNSKESGFPGPH